MEISKTQFDYEAILNVCGIQDVNVKKALEEVKDCDTKFQEQLKTLKNLCAERDQKNEKLCDIKLTLKKQLHKVNKIRNNIAIMNKELKLVLDQIANLHEQLKKQSNDLITNMAKMDEQLQSLFSQFESETLAKLIQEVDNELLYYRDNQNQLERTYEELRKCKPTFDHYERLQILKIIGNEYLQEKSIDEIQKKLGEKGRNIEFLTTEYNKKLQMLQKYA
ncbi:hypothetical protein NQ317_017686 [Molorchus minor]|uniref:Uncharacterized protein n=1 Tax=Molorchus minor TaxID=1323400 RepID=A0ABQ9JPL2_9CUCU|nr:hypothetical protein NQ317_017686 [Molorchus minor]